MKPTVNKPQTPLQNAKTGGFSLFGLKIGKLKELRQAVSNYMYVSKGNYEKLLAANLNSTPVYVQVKGFIFNVEAQNDLSDQECSIHKYARQYMRVSETYDTLELQHYQIPEDLEYRLSSIHFEVEPIELNYKLEVESGKIEEFLKKLYKSQFFGPNQMIYFEFEGGKFLATVNSSAIMETGISKMGKISLSCGLLNEETDLEVTAKPSQVFKISGKAGKALNLFNPDFKFEDLGVGGLDKEMFEIFRQAFTTRRFSASALAKYKLSHVKGIILYGPPGTGKTLIARQLGKVLRAKEPKIVNGPEIFNKYVGESQANIRKLFDDARKDQATLGEMSPLHIIIFDEFDAIAKQRGRDASGTGVGDDVVNQLLSMIDGVESLNNILVIGMTNRLDVIDSAILRPGRFSVKIEVGLPDENGRAQILNIHTAEMKKNKLLSSNVELPKIAKLTKNYTGAELEDVVKNAATFCFNRNNDMMNFKKDFKLNENCILEMQDFDAALDVVKPEFGIDSNRFDVYIRDPLIEYGQRYTKIIETIRVFMNQVRNGQSQLSSILLEGPCGSGKTSVGAWAAVHSDFPFVKMFSPDNLIGLTEIGKVNYIVKLFEDAYKSKLSVILIDEIERLIEYVSIGPRFNNVVLQAILVMIKKIPQKPTNRIFIIGTTSSIEVMRDLEITSCFNAVITVPSLMGAEEIGAVFKACNVKNADLAKVSSICGIISIKKLLLLIRLIQNKGSSITPDIIKECLSDITDQSINF